MGDNNKKAEADLSVLLNEDTSDEAKEKIKTVFEAAVEQRAAELAEALEAKVDELVEERLAEALAEVEESIDKYTDHVAEKWLEENKIAIESSLKVDIAESLIEGLRDLVAQHDLELPEDADGVVEGLVARNEELVARLNESLESNMVLNEKLEMIEVESKLEEIVEGLAETQATKLRGLAENVKFKDVADFEKKVRGMRETLFKEAAPATAGASPDSDSPPLVEDKKPAVAATGDPMVDQIVEGVRRTFAPRS